MTLLKQLGSHALFICSGGSNNSAPPKLKNEQLSWEVFLDSGVNNQAHGKIEEKKSRKQVADNQGSSDGPNLRRSRSMSSRSHHESSGNFTRSSNITVVEQRLRERVRELAEQNVSLQREVSFVNERETESQSKLAHTDQQVKMLTGMAEKMKAEILSLQQNLFELQDRCNIAEENRDCLRRNFEEKEKECKELHKCVTRLQRTCNEQEKSIIGLRDGFSEDFHKNQSVESIDKHIKKMQMELMRDIVGILNIVAPLAMAKIEALSMEGLKIQFGMSVL